MKKILLSILLLFPIVLYGQVYNNPGGTINTCSGTFYDTGGAGSNYGINQNITTTFCSNSGNCVQLNFGAINIDNGWHFLTIYDGPNTGSPVIGTYTGTNSPGVITSSTGCITVRFTSDGFIAGSSFGWSAAISCVACPPPSFSHPTVGIAGEYVGSCLVANCGPFTYTDNGGAGNYSNNINQIYRTFCPSVAGNCMSVTFNSFRTEPGWDFLLVNNGPTQNSPTFTGFPASATNYAGITGLHGNLNGVAPFGYTSTDDSGCLTFRFYSDGSGVEAGWSATLQCTPCAIGPSGTENTDCMNMTALCSSAPVSTMATGPGIVAEGCSGSTCPAGGENHSNWYTFTAQTTGTLSITIAPTVATDDYDFAIYGPNVSCGALGSPLRCSDSGASGTTSASGTAGAGNTDLSESVAGNGIVRILDVVAGQSYIMVVDKWSPSGGTGYTLSFGGSASLDCTVLPIELSEFNAVYQPDLDVVDLHWITESENNSSHFEVEKSIDGIEYRVISTVSAAGNSTNETQYITIDEEPEVSVNYYRLKMYDTNGEFKYSEIKAVNILNNVYDMLSVFPNPTSGLTEIVFNSYTKEEVVLNVTSYNGTTIVNTPLNAKNGGNRFDLDMTDQANGIYIVTITTNDKIHKSKLIKN